MKFPNRFKIILLHFLLLQGIYLLSLNLYGQANSSDKDLPQDTTPSTSEAPSPSTSQSPESVTTTPNQNPLSTEPNSLSKAAPPAYVLEVEVGVNFFGYNTNQTIDRYNLDNISDTTALSYNVKTGVVFLDNWKSLLAFGYSKRPNFEYPLNNIRLNQAILENHRYFRLGIEQQYLFWKYTSKFNFALGLESSWLQRSVSITERAVNNGNTSNLSQPRTFTWNEYFISPKAKFFYRISRYSTLHFSLEYHTLFPSLEHYPQILFGIDISFYFYKPQEQPLPTVEEILPQVPENVRKETEKTLRETFSN